MSGIAAVVFKGDQERAQKAFEQVNEWVEQELLKLETASVAARDASGKVTLEETKSYTAGAKKRRGGFWGLLLGLAFAGPLIGVAAGVGVGALLGRRGKKQANKEFAEELGNTMEPGDSALFVSFELMARPNVLEWLKRLDGSLIVSELSAEEEAEMEAALEKETVNAEIAKFKRDQIAANVDKSATDGIQNIQ